MMESSAGVAERGQTVGGVERTRRRRRASRPLPPAPRRLDFADLLSNVRDHIALTKPRIISLLLWTTVTTMFVAQPSGLALSTILWTCLGGYLAAGGAGAINHYIDRDIDARMGRTRGRPMRWHSRRRNYPVRTGGRATFKRISRRWQSGHFVPRVARAGAAST